MVYPVTVSSNISPAYAVSTQSIINNIQNTTTATNTSPSMKSFMLITSAATITTTTTNFSNSSCNPQYFRLMQNSSNHRRHSVSGTVNISLAQQQQIEKRKLKRQTKTKTTTTKKNDIEWITNEKHKEYSCRSIGKTYCENVWNCVFVTYMIYILISSFRDYSEPKRYVM